MRKVLISSGIVLFITSCHLFGMTEERQLACLDNYIATERNLPVYSEVRAAVIDSCKAWVDRGLKMKWYTDRLNILDSVVFFNKDYTKCLLLLIQKSPSDTLYKFDNVQILGAEIINGKWQIYHKSFPTLAWHIKYNNFKEREASFLSKNARLDIIKKGFFYNNTCDINYSFIDSDDWFADWIRKKHELFLKGEK